LLQEINNVGLVGVVAKDLLVWVMEFSFSVFVSDFGFFRKVGMDESEKDWFKAAVSLFRYV
jgi:hypothetical protein